MQPTTPPDEPMSSESPGAQETAAPLPGEREAHEIQIRHVQPTPKRARHAPVHNNYAAGGLARIILQNVLGVIRSEEYRARYPQEEDMATIGDIRARLEHKQETFGLCIRGLLPGALSRAKLRDDLPHDAEVDLRQERYYPNGVHHPTCRMHHRCHQTHPFYKEKTFPHRQCDVDL